MTRRPWPLHIPLRQIRLSPTRLRRIGAISQQLPRVRDLQRLLKLTTRLIVRSFGAQHATVYIANPTESEPVYRRMLSSGPSLPPEIVRLSLDSPVIRWFRQYRRALKPQDVAELQQQRPRSDAYRRLHLIVENLRAEVIVPSFQGRRLLGVLVLGPRLDGQAYAEQDVEALRRLAQGCAIALENAWRYDQLKTTAQKLHAAQERLLRQERTVAAGKLAMGLAHEIKNPLAAIKTFTEFLAERYDDAAFRQEFIRIITKEVDRINGIVQSLADITKQPLLLKVEPTDVQQLLKEVVALLSNDCLKRDIAVQATFEAEPILISGDVGQLKQAFLNLCMNALEAMPKGGTLSVSCVYEESQAVIRVTDTGVGVPPEHVAVLFEPFFTTKEGGMGLGLAVVKQIVEQHFGTIRVKSELGRGTTFEVCLPWAMRFSQKPGASFSQEHLRAMEPPTLSTKVDLLVVDDEPKIRELLAQHFEAQGCRVRGVASGEEAVALVDTEPPQIILLDLKLSGIDGFETLKRLKTKQLSLPVIVISSYIEDEATDRHLQELGATVCLRKPVNLPHLQRAVAEVAAGLSPRKPLACPEAPAAGS